MIEVQSLVKSFGHSAALRGVDLRVADGEFLTVVGPNGAGKTTLLRILAGLLQPPEGSVRINRIPLDPGDADLRRCVGFLSDRPIMYSHLTVMENLEFYGRLFEVLGLHERVDELLGLVGLTSRQHHLAGTLSRGMQQRLSLARSLVHDPSVLLLDEPYAGLDQEAVEILCKILRSAGPARRTVVMATHNLQQGLEWCDRIVMLSSGRVVFRGDRQTLSWGELREVYRQRSGALRGRERAER
jgi:heme exporter protein A